MVRPIKLYPEDQEILLKRCDEVHDFEEASLIRLILDMIDTMRAHKGQGLAAPQIGFNARVIIAELTSGTTVMVNPQIHAWGGRKYVHKEGCLSLPGLEIPIERDDFVSVEYEDKAGGKQSRQLYDHDARIVQHEIDHLNGILIIDRLASKVLRRLALDKYRKLRRSR